MRGFARVMLWLMLLAVQLGAGLAGIGYLVVIVGGANVEGGGLLALSGAAGMVSVAAGWAVMTTGLAFLIAVLDSFDALISIAEEEARENHRARRTPIQGRVERGPMSAEERLRAEVRGELDPPV